jgi:hypothetical protein
MPDRSNRAFFSAADPDAEPYARAIRRQNAINESRERSSAGASSNAAKIADTAKLAGDVTTTAELVPAAVAALSRDVDDLEAAKAVARFTGPVGRVLSAVAATAGFKADRKNGMPLDEAFIKHGGGLLLGAGLGAAGRVAGSVIGAPGGAAGSLFGGAAVGAIAEKDGEFLAEDLADTWGDAKRATRWFTRQVGALNEPSYWVQPRFRGSSDY